MSGSVRAVHRWPARSVALLLSWVMPATTVWSAAPLTPYSDDGLRADVPLPAYRLTPVPAISSTPVESLVTLPPIPKLSDTAAAALARLMAALQPAVALPLAPLAATFSSDGNNGGNNNSSNNHDHDGHHHCEHAQNHHHHSGNCGCDETFFGPERLVRTNGSKTEYVRTIAVPSWVASPFEMSVENGDSNGQNRVSSAWIYINGHEVARPSDFGTNDPGFEKTVTLTPTTTLKVVLASKPGSYLTINICGRGRDHTAPRVTWTAPVPGSTVNDATPMLRVSYQDPAGSGEPSGSGVDLASLVVTLDNVNRTSLFTKRAGDASVELPASLTLAPGTHHLKATIEDEAGNVGTGLADFVVDATLPAIQVTQPARGAYLPTLSPTIRVTYADAVALDLATLEIKVDGSNRTAAFTRGPAEAVATLTLASGAHDVVANIRDKAGNAAVPASTSFNLDVTPPVVTVGKPVADSRHGAAQVEAIVQYRDDQALDLASFRADVDGTVVTLGQGPEGAMGLLPPLPDGQHTLTARIKDRAGNERVAQSRFWVDTGVPDIQIVQPPSGFVLATATPLVVVAYHDNQGVALATFKLTVGGHDRTSSCQVGPDSAACTIPPAPQGDTTAEAEIKDLGGNRGTAISTFTVDSLAPTGSMTSPAAIVGTATPAITFTYEDAGSGVVASSVTVRLDGSAPVSWFSAGATSATGVPPVPLSEGLHHVVLTLEDGAGNPATIEGSFTVDTVAPTATVAAPANEAFTNDSTPFIRITYADIGGTGVVTPGSVHVYHRQGDDPETEITAFFQVGATEATGIIPEASALTDGTHHLRVQIKDQAANVRETQSLFVLDTVAPTYSVIAPARDAFVSTKTPALIVTYADAGSGVDTATFAFKVDATDFTARLVAGPAQAAGALQAGDALEEGKHAASVAIFDRAGNPAVPSAHEFVVDTVAPVASVLVPTDGTYLGDPQSLVRVQYADTEVAGAGNGVGSVEVVVDGVDRTVEFTVGPTEATAQLNPPLGEGTHTVTVNVRDWANNAGAGSSTFFVDLTAPLVTIIEPPAGPRNDASVVVTGTVADTDPQVTVECSAGGPASPATLGPTAAQRSFTCTLTLADGATEIVATARDRFGREGSDRRRFVLDHGNPVVIIEQPTSGECTAADTVPVSGRVLDASIDGTTTVTVTVGGALTDCVPSGNGACTFSATAALGAGPQATVHVQAKDLAGNVGEASVTLCVDREAPTVTIDPPASSYVKGPALTVHGTVSDTLTPTTVEVNGQPESAPSLALSRTFTVLVPVVDGPVELKATARDAAGNGGTSAPVVVNVDGTPPQIVFDSPEPGIVTRAASIVVSGHVIDASPVTLTREGQNIPVGSGGAFTIDVPLPGGAIFTGVSLAFAAIDAAGNPGSASLEVIVDRKAPTLTVASPHSGDVLVSLPIVVQGTFEDDTDTTVTVNGQVAQITGHAWQAIFATLPEGPQQFTVSASDKAINTTTAPPVDVVVDLGAPVVAIDAPATGTLTRESDILVHGTVQETGTVQVTVNGVSASTQRTGPSTWTYTVTVPLQEGNQEIVALAEDAAHRTDRNDDHVLVTRDSTPPVVVLTAPSQVSRGKPGSATAVVTDADLASLTVTWGAAQATCTSSPCTLALTVPEGVASGTTIPATATATDLAGNVGTAAPRGVKVVADGVVTGQVLSDATGLVLDGATVRMTAGVGETATSSDEDGRYSLPTGEPFATIVVSKSGHTSVERDLAVESGAGTVPVDARLTPLAAAQIVGAEGGVLHAPAPAAAPVPRRPALTVTVPSSTVPDGTAFRLTTLSPQGLPGLLPLGWAPVAAFDVQLSSPVAGALEGVVLFAEGAAPIDPVHLVRYDTSAHAWELRVRDLTTAGNALTASFSQAGAYAFVVADDASVAVPAVGETLTGVDMMPVPATATSTGRVNPSSVAPTGGTAKGSLEIQSPLPLPSGTVVQAEVGETYTLRETDASGANKVASTEKRLQDIVLFRPKGGAAGSVPPLPASTALGAEVAVTPSRTYGRAEIVKGEVVLDFLAGREGVRGTVGGNEPVDLEAADVRLRVPAHAFGEDTALSLEVPVSLSAFLPSVPGLDPLSEVVLDFSGKTLSVSAGLSIAAGIVGEGETVLVAQVVRALTDSIPQLAVVARAQLEDGRVTTIPYPGLPGIVEGGRYVFYRSVPVGFVAGTAMAGGSPVRALIEPVLASPWPFIALSRAGGDFILAVPPGTVGLKASVPRTPYVGSASVQVTEDATTPFTFALLGAGTTLAVTPPDGTVGVPVNVPFEIRSTAPLQPDTVSTQTIRLFKVGTPANTPVTVRLVLAQNRRSVSVIPEPPPSADPDAPPKPALLFEKSYILEAAGLKDSFGKDVPSVAVTFTTRDDSPEARDLRKLVFSIPDENGIVKITAPAGTLAPGTTILVINSGNGYVLSLSAGNDGEVNGEINASVSDRLLVTITDPEGHATSFERSQFFDAATGATVVGEGGGVIEGPGGAELRIPEGALDKPVKLKVTAVTEADYQTAFEGDTRKPALPGAKFGSVLRIEASEETVFKKEVDLAFPLPDFSSVPEGERPPKPEDAFYQIYRRIEGPCRNGQAECPPSEHEVFFEALDNAFVEGEGANRKVVTASYPFTGYGAGWSRWDPLSGISFSPLGGAVGYGGVGVAATAWAIVMWTYTALLPGASVSGVITGRVLQPSFKPGVPDPEYKGVPRLMVKRDDQQDPEATVAITQGDGRFTFYDPHFKGGTVEVRTEYQGQVYKATAFAVERSDTKIITDPGLAPLVTAGFFQNIATANITLPLLPPETPAPKFGIHIMKESGGSRQEVNTVIAGTPILLGFTTADDGGGVATVMSATISGQAKNVVKETAPPSVLPMNYLLQDPNTEDGRFRPAQAGNYTVEATALPPIGPAITEQRAFRVLAPGGKETEPLPGPPAVLGVVPSKGAGGVPISVFPEITFSEPVTNVPGNVKLFDSKGNPGPSLKLSGVGVNVAGDVVTFDNVSVTSRVTSLTVEPMGGLKYGEKYRLVVEGGIQDLDQPTNFLETYESNFETFRPAPVGGSADQTAMVGLAVLDDRAYALETQYAGGTGGFQNGVLHVYDVTDPQEPADIPPGATIAYPPRDIAAQKRILKDDQDNDVQQKLVALAASSRTYWQLQGEIVYYNELISSPGNVFLYNVDEDTPRWVGAVSLTQNIVDGYTSRIAMDGDSLFAATFRKGIQVVSLSQAMSGFEDEEPFEVRKQLFSGGYRNYAVVQTIPMTSDPPASPVLLNLNDLKVGHLLLDGTGARLVLATGSSPAVALVIVNPDSGEKVYQGKLEGAGGSLSWGTAIAMAQIANRDLALVGGLATIGGSSNGVAVVDVTDPRAFQILAWVKLDHAVGDILINGTTAIVSGDRGSRAPDGTLGVATLINLADPLQPFVAGTITGIGSRMALAGDILLSTQREFLKGNTTPLSGVRTATLGVAPLIGRPPVFGVNRANKSLEPNTLRLQVVPATTEVETAEIEVYRDGTLVSPSIPIPAFSGNTTYEFKKGSSFSADSRYQARLVINRGLGNREKTSGKQSLRPARMDLLGTAEAPVTGADPFDVIRMFNSAPQVSLTFKSFSLLGIGDNVSVNVEGTVSSAVAPIEKVVVNEEVITVTQTGTGVEGLGPFTGKYTAAAEVGPQAELVTAYAVDALNHVSTQSLGIYPRERILGVIPGRDVTPFAPLIPGATSAGPYQFRIELKDKGSSAPTARIKVGDGDAAKVLTLKRQGDTFRSDQLVALPESLRLPASAGDPVKNTRLAMKMGVKPQITYGTVEARAMVSGIVLVPPGPSQVADFVDPASGQGYVIEVGKIGTSGGSISATVTSLDGNMEALAPGAPPASQTFTLTQASADPNSPSYNLYRANGPEALLPIMDGIQASGGKPQRVVPFGRVKVAAAGDELILPVGAGADRVRWETLDVRPLYAEGLLDILFSFLTGPALPKFWQVTQSATFLRGNTPITGLRVSGYLDRRTRLVDADGGMTAVVPAGDGFAPATFPQISDTDGKVRFRVKAGPVEEGSTQPLAGVVLALTDVVGIRAMALLGTGGTTPLPALADVTSEDGKAYKTTPVVAGYVSAGGVPRRHSEWYKRLAKLVVDQVVGDDPQLRGVRDKLANGLTLKGILYTQEQLDEYFTYFMLGAIVGFPRGAVGALKDSVVGVYELVGSVGPLIKFLVPKSGAEAVLQLAFAPIPGGVLLAKGVLAVPYLLEQRAKLKQILPILEKAAEFLGREEIQAQLTVALVSSVLGGYQKELGKLVGYLGMTEGTPGFRPLVLGYSVGAVSGYLAEFGVELFATSLVGEGVGAALPMMLKAAQTGARGEKVVVAMKAISKIFLAGEETGKIAKTFSLVIKFLDALGPNVLERWMLKIAEFEGGPQRVYTLMVKFGEVADGEARILAMARGLSAEVAPGVRGVDNIVETLIVLEKMAADVEFRGATSRLVLVSAENAEGFAKAVGRAVDIGKASPELAPKFELLFANIDDAEKYFATFGKLDGEALEKSLKGAAEYVPICP